MVKLQEDDESATESGDRTLACHILSAHIDLKGFLSLDIVQEYPCPSSRGFFSGCLSMMLAGLFITAAKQVHVLSSATGGCASVPLAEAIHSSDITIHRRRSGERHPKQTSSPLPRASTTSYHKVSCLMSAPLHSCWPNCSWI